MSKQTYIEKLKQEIEGGCDARLESKLLLALEAGLTPNDFFIAPNGLFYRPYSKDVLCSEITEDSNKKRWKTWACYSSPILAGSQDL